MMGLLERAKELREQTAVTHKAKDDAPNYHRVGNASLQRCGTCRHFTDSGRCDLYDFDADAMYTCDSWRPDIERLKKARVGVEVTTKETAATPTATYAHGPGGLLSPAGIGGRRHGVVSAAILPGDSLVHKPKRKRKKEVLTAVTTKPGDKYRSLKDPALYEKLLAKGYSKIQAAAISNAMAKRGKKAKKETAVSLLEYAKSLKHLSGSHNQKRHGWRFNQEYEGKLARGLGIARSPMNRNNPAAREYENEYSAYMNRAMGKWRDTVAGKPQKPTAAKKRKIAEAEREYLQLNKRYSRARAIGADTSKIDGDRTAALNKLADLLGVTPYQIVPTANGVFVSKEYDPLTRAKELRKQEPQPATFTVFKDKTGRYRWVAISSTAYRDRDGEIVSTKALADDVAHADTTGEYGALRWWHVPGLDLGDCDFNMLYGRSLIESGTFKNDRIAERVKEKAHLLKLSLGFRHPADEPDKSGVFHTIRRFERSLIPPEGNASNLFTVLTVS